VGDALVFENERLQQRMELFFDKLEAILRKHLRLVADSAGDAAPTAVANAQASIASSYLVGSLQRFARSGFRRTPMEQIHTRLELLLPRPVCLS
jgi:TetR/AcrR family transcriptional regulator